MNILAIPTTFGLSKPLHGGQNRFSNLIKELISWKNKIIVLQSSKYSDSGDEKITKVYNYPEFEVFGRGLFTFFRDFDFPFILKIFKIVKKEKIDLIQITHPTGGAISLKILMKITNNPLLVVYDAYNVEADFSVNHFRDNPNYSKVERYLLPKYIKFLEKIVCRYVVDQLTVVSASDKKKIIELYHVNEEKITIIPSGCHIRDISSSATLRKQKRKIMGIGSDKTVLFFHGSYAHLPNQESIEIIKNNIAPRFKNDENVLFLVGGFGVPEFESYNVKSIGFIDNIPDFLQVVDIAIMPLIRGAGTKLKIFDYMSVGLPIISTAKGVEGIDVVNGEHVIVTSDADDNFVRMISSLMNNKDQRDKIGENARKLVKEKYNWHEIGASLNFTYQNLLEEKNADT